MAANWDLIGGNPAPGNPEWISQQAQLLLTISSDGVAASEQLRGIEGRWSNSDWSGETAEVFLGLLAGTVLTDLQKLIDSYGDAGDALRAFAMQLTELQGQANLILQVANQHSDELSAAEAGQGEASANLARLQADATSLRNQIFGLDGDIALRELVAGVNLVTDGKLVALRSERADAQSQLSETEAAILAGETTLSLQTEAVNEARAALADDDRNATWVSYGFADSCATARQSLESASSVGIHNLSEADRIWQSACRAFDELDHLAESTIHAVNLAMHGDFAPLDRELREGALLALRGAHDALAVVRDAEDVVADVMQVAAPILSFLAIALVLVAPEASVALMAASKAASVIGVAARAAEVETSALEVVTDQASLDLGGGSETELSHDGHQLKEDAISAAETGVGALLGMGAGKVLSSVIPDPADAIDSILGGKMTFGMGLLVVGAHDGIDDGASALAAAPSGRPGAVALLEGFA